MTTPADRVVATPAECRAAILDVIRGATREIGISLFRCNDPETFTELANARRRGVAVRALMTARAAGRKGKIEKLQRALVEADVSVSVYADPVVKYHAKVPGGGRWPGRCRVAQSHEEVLFADAGCARRHLRRRGRVQLARGDVRGLRHAPDIRLPQSASRCRARTGPGELNELVMGATSSIRIVDAKLSDPAFVALLAARRAAAYAWTCSGASATAS